MNPHSPRVLVVDDDADLLQLITMRLSAAGYDVTPVASGDQALANLAVSRPQVVVTDLRMEGMDGMALFDAIHREAPMLPVVILTAHGTIPDAVAATRRGVFSFLTKPFDSQVLLATVADARRLSSVPDGGAEDWSAEILTRSATMEALLAQARRVADSDASVCILGASGSGKELLARAIHRAGRRAKAPFVAVNCSAIPEGLLESELFGHRRGAFTGAVADRHGLFQAAKGGTLFLDEIGDMPLGLQVKLLRALEEKAVRPVGSDEAVAVDVRIISATHRNLEARIAAGEFREDFFYRISVVKLEVPPLAARTEDIPLMAGTFLARAAERHSRPPMTFSPEAMELLITAPWPGNVRHLLNVVERAVVLSPTEVIPASIIRESLDSGIATLAPLDEARRAFERHYLVRILKIADGNVARAARLAGRNRTEFYRLLERHALEPEMFKSGAVTGS